MKRLTQLYINKYVATVNSHLALCVAAVVKRLTMTVFLKVFDYYFMHVALLSLFLAGTQKILPLDWFCNWAGEYEHNKNCKLPTSFECSVFFFPVHSCRSIAVNRCKLTDAVALHTPRCSSPSNLYKELLLMCPWRAVHAFKLTSSHLFLRLPTRYV